MYDEFAIYIAALWGGKFSHNYRVSRDRAWRRWREICPTNDGRMWSCSSLEEAERNYSWRDGGIKLNFNSLSDQLKSGIESRNEVGIAKTCLDIFAWGGVARSPNDASRVWIEAQKSSSLLATRLIEAHRLLTSCEASLDCFNGRDLLMNSAMTKIYAACDPGRLVIYDGRVGAALGLLTKDYLRSIKHNRALPAKLKFGWGRSWKKYLHGHQNERDPSDGDFNFPALFRAKSDLPHAEMMRGASCLLVKAAAHISKQPQSVLPKLERALFMIGYDVSRQ